MICYYCSECHQSVQEGICLCDPDDGDEPDHYPVCGHCGHPLNGAEISTQFCTTCREDLEL